MGAEEGGAKGVNGYSFRGVKIAIKSFLILILKKGIQPSTGYL